jgi:hypothetical protein
MTVYVVKWIDNSKDNPCQLFAATSYKSAKLKYQEILRQSFPNHDIIIDDEEEALKKWTINTQTDLVESINTLW